MSASIKSVFVEDFQSHQKTRIELPGPGQLCVIVGPTDSGKTAIVRALRLLLYNVPLGIEYIRVGRNMATVAVEMSDGTKVARERSKSVNRYRVTKPGQSPQVFEGFGGSVPLEVQEATGVRTVSIGDSLELALNLSEQLDGPFLGKSVSGPAKAKILGALAGTEEVDEAQRTLGTDLHRANQEEKRLADTVQALEAKITEYNYLPELAQKIEALDSLLDAAKVAQSRLCNLKSAKASLDSLNAQRVSALGTLARWGGLAEAITHAQNAQGNITMLQVLRGHEAALERIGDEFGKWYPVAYVRWAGLDEGTATYEAAQASWGRVKVLMGLSTEFLVTKQGIGRCEASLSRWQGLDNAKTAYDGASAGAARLQALSQLRSRLGQVLTAQLGAGQAYARWRRLDDAVSVTAAVPVTTGRLSALLKASTTLTNIRQARVVAEGALAQHSKALGDAQSLYADTLLQIGVCPTCGSIVSPDSIKTHIEEVA